MKKDTWKGPGVGTEPAGEQLSALGFDQIPASRVNATNPPSADAITGYVEEGLRGIESQGPLPHAFQASRPRRLVDDGAHDEDDDRGQRRMRAASATVAADTGAPAAAASAFAFRGKNARAPAAVAIRGVAVTNAARALSEESAEG